MSYSLSRTTESQAPVAALPYLRAACLPVAIPLLLGLFVAAAAAAEGQAGPARFEVDLSAGVRLVMVPEITANLESASPISPFGATDDQIVGWGIEGTTGFLLPEGAGLFGQPSRIEVRLGVIRASSDNRVPSGTDGFGQWPIDGVGGLQGGSSADDTPIGHNALDFGRYDIDVFYTTGFAPDLPVALRASAGLSYIRTHQLHDFFAPQVDAFSIHDVVTTDAFGAILRLEGDWLAAEKISVDFNAEVRLLGAWSEFRARQRFFVPPGAPANRFAEDESTEFAAAIRGGGGVRYAFTDWLDVGVRCQVDYWPVGLASPRYALYQGFEASLENEDSLIVAGDVFIQLRF